MSVSTHAVMENMGCERGEGGGDGCVVGDTWYIFAPEAVLICSRPAVHKSICAILDIR